MISDLEDNTFKISVPIITNEELERFEYSLETDLDNIVHQISETVSRDKDIIILKKVIEKQSKEIEELNLENIELKQSKIVDKNSIPNQDNFYDCYNFIHKDKIKAKIEELEKQDRENRMSHNYLVIPVLQSLLEKE